MSSVPKTRSERLEELRQAVVVLETGVALATRTRDVAHLLPVVGQLRSLLLVLKGQTPLLVSLAEELDFPLEFYSMPLDYLDNEEIAAILGPSRIQWAGDSIRADPEGPPFGQKVTMREWLASTVAVVREKKFTGEEVLLWVANKTGGAHYDPTWPQELATISTFESNGMPTHYLTLARLGEITAKLGSRLLKKASS